MKAKIISVNISEEKGEKKRNVGSCFLLKDKGLTGDGHAGFMHRQVSLLAMESIEKIKAKGLDVKPGDFAENLTTEGIVLYELPVGTTLRTSKGVLLRVTQIGKECHTRCAIFQAVGDCVMPREGIFTEVLTEGDVSVGDELEVI
jgi:molybdopterin adenylyltransferase